MQGNQWARASHPACPARRKRVRTFDCEAKRNILGGFVRYFEAVTRPHNGTLPSELRLRRLSNDLHESAKGTSGEAQHI